MTNGIVINTIVILAILAFELIHYILFICGVIN